MKDFKTTLAEAFVVLFSVGNFVLIFIRIVVVFVVNLYYIFTVIQYHA